MYFPLETLTFVGQSFNIVLASFWRSTSYKACMDENA